MRAGQPGGPPRPRRSSSGQFRAEADVRAELDACRAALTRRRLLIHCLGFKVAGSVGRVIQILTLLTLVSFVFVVAQLYIRRSVTRPPAAGLPPSLEIGADGGMTAVSVRVDLLERRLRQSEERSVNLRRALEAGKKDEIALKERLAKLEEEVQALRRLRAPSPQEASVVPPPEEPTPPAPGPPDTQAPPPQ